MTAPVARLEDMCLDVLCDNWTPLWTRSPESENDLVWSDHDLVLHSDIAEKLLYKLSKKGKLNDKILSMFAADRTFLKNVHIADVSKLKLKSEKGLETLQTHRLVSLSINHIGWRFSLCNILSCLKSEHWSSLRRLRCANADRRSILSLKSLPKSLASLRSLTFENMQLSNSCLVIIASSIPNMQYLDISGNHDISDISPIKRQVQLVTLIMHDMDMLAKDSTVTTLFELKNLEHLDVSVHIDHTESFMTALMSCPSSNPNLTSLDLSGRNAAPENMIRTYLDKHPSLRFLGLCFSQACGYSIFDVRSTEYKPGIDVVGNSNLDQVTFSMRHYQSRDPVILNILLHLRDALHNDEDCCLTTDNDEILMALMGVIRSNPDMTHLQWMITRESMRCLKRLLEDGRVSQIEPDTVERLLRTCHDLKIYLRSAFRTNVRFPGYYKTLRRLHIVEWKILELSPKSQKHEEMEVVERKETDGIVLQKADVPRTILRQGHKLFVLDSSDQQ